MATGRTRAHDVCGGEGNMVTDGHIPGFHVKPLSRFIIVHLTTTLTKVVIIFCVFHKRKMSHSWSKEAKETKLLSGAGNLSAIM